MEIKRGDYWSRTSYGKVISVNGSDITIENEEGHAWRISREIFENEFKVDSNFTETVQLSQTALSATMLSKPGVIMTVNFNKKVDEKKVTEMLVSYATNTTGTVSAAKELAKQILTGEERTMIGRHYHHVDEFGRLSFVDMQEVNDSAKSYDTRMRLIDPRTVNWVIVDNVKYIKK